MKKQFGLWGYLPKSVSEEDKNTICDAMATDIRMEYESRKDDDVDTDGKWDIQRIEKPSFDYPSLITLGIKMSIDE